MGSQASLFLRVTPPPEAPQFPHPSPREGLPQVTPARSCQSTRVAGLGFLVVPSPEHLTHPTAAVLGPYLRAGAVAAMAGAGAVPPA